MKVYELITASRISRGAELAQREERDVWLSDDSGLRGTGRLLIRITSSGIKRFYFRWSAGGHRKTVALGPYSRTRREHFLTIAEARSAAHRLAPAVKSDVASLPPAVSLVAAESLQPDPTSPATVSGATRQFTVSDLCAVYVAHLKAQKKQSARSVENQFHRYIHGSVVAHVEARLAAADQFAAILRGIIKDGHGVTASKVRSALHSAYSHAMSAKLNPAAAEFSVDPQIRLNPIKEIASLSEYRKPGERFLNRDELAEFWRALHEVPLSKLTLAERFVRLSVRLGGQRAQQLLRVQTKDVDLYEGLVLLLDPKGNRSRPRDHLLPVGPTAMPEIKWLLGHAADVGSLFLFPGASADGRLQNSTISTSMRQLSATLVGAGRIARPFRYADLRRTIETTLASLGVSKDVRAQIQSHGLSGVQTRHYDRHDYLREKREALLLWENYLESTLEQKHGS